jgi:tyrosine-protein kinase
VFRKVRPPTRRGEAKAPKPPVGLSEDRLTLVERYMIDREDAEARTQARADETSFRPKTADPNSGDLSGGALPADVRSGQRGLDLEETNRESTRESPELVPDRSVVAPATERVDELVGVESAEDAASRVVGGSDAQAGSLDHGRAAHRLGNVTEEADEFAEGEGSAFRGRAVDDGVTDVELLEPEDEVSGGDAAGPEHATAVAGEVEAPFGTDRVSLREGRNALETERSDGGHVDRKIAGELSQEGGGERASEAVSRADEDEREAVIASAGLPAAEQASTEPERRNVRATLAKQTASRSRRGRSHLKRDGIPVDSDSRGLMTEAFPNRPASLADYLTILRRRMWIILIPLLLAPILTYVFAKGEKPVYKATANVYINLTPATLQAVRIFNQTAAVDPTRYFQTEATLARDPSLIDSVARKAGVSQGKFASISSVAPSAGANLLSFSVQTGNAARAAVLANSYARAFTRFQPAQDRKLFAGAIFTVHRKLRLLRAQGVPETSPVVSALQSLLSELEQGLVLEAGTSPRVVQPAAGGSAVSPRPGHDALLGLALGLILGIGLAFFAEALDKRIRSERELEDILGLPLLGRLPGPPRRLRRAEELPILVEPRSASAEAVKKLRTNLEFLNLGHDTRVIMVTSALEQEGKSTTLASLAVALARSGRRVALVDLDLRAPFLHRFFQVSSLPGVIDVVVNRCKLSDALKPVHIPGFNRGSSHRASSLDARSEPSGLLAVLPAGALGPDPAFLVGTPGVAELIDQLKNDWDFVLIDAPPLPAVDDGLALSALVDGVLVVVRSGAVPRRVLQEMARLLDTSPAEVLGFVLTGLNRSESHGYGYGYGYGRDRWRRGVAARLIEAPAQNEGEAAAQDNGEAPAHDNGEAPAQDNGDRPASRDGGERPRRASSQR